MLVMGITASILGFRKSPTDANGLGFLMTAYFVVLALTAVRPVSPGTRRMAALQFSRTPVIVGLLVRQGW